MYLKYIAIIPCGRSLFLILVRERLLEVGFNNIEGEIYLYNLKYIHFYNLNNVQLIS